MKSLYLNYNGFLQFCKGSKTKKFPFNFSRLPPAPPAVFLRIRKFLVLRGAEDERRQAECVRLRTYGVCRSEDGATPRRGGVGITTDAERTMKFGVATRVARANYQSLRDCCSKKVRAKRTISPPNQKTSLIKLVF